jgi:hypothetical protein
MLDAKYREAEELRAQHQTMSREIADIERHQTATGDADLRLAELDEKCSTVDAQEAQFIDEINRYTRALLEIDAASAVTGNELLMGTNRIPKFRGSSNREAAALAQSLYSLRMVLIKRYAESINSGCTVQ